MQENTIKIKIKPKNPLLETLSYLENEDFNLKDDLNNAQIYIAENQINGKIYVGKANCYTGKNNNRWGTIGRWKSHVTEACKNNDDHCVLLNNAIRKYGENNFVIKTIYKGNIDSISEKEIYYIDLFNSMKPSGYNLKFGGDKGKNNPETIEKMKLAHTGHIHTETQKENISKGQIGNRRKSKPRKHEEDNNLPKYINARRNSKGISEYSIEKFPIGINTVEYLKSFSFSIAKYGNKEDALEAAINHLNNLKTQYKYIEEEVKELKENNIKESIQAKKEQMEKDKLSEYIYPVIKNNKIAGYYVDGILNNKGVPFQKRYFQENTNRWNLDQANKFVDMLKYINENNVDMSLFPIESIDVNDIEKSFYEKYYLPKYFNVLRKKGIIKGFCINGFPDDYYKDGKYKKEFQIKDSKTFDDVYKECISELFFKLSK
jgi:hypothetical protein